MNAIVREVFEILHRTAAMRAQLIAILSDGDLAYRLPGGNLTPGEPCRDIGLVERSYIDSFITFRQSFDYPSTDPLLDRPQGVKSGPPPPSDRAERDSQALEDEGTVERP